LTLWHKKKYIYLSGGPHSRAKGGKESKEKRTNLPKIWVGLVRLGRFGSEKDEYPHTRRREAAHTKKKKIFCRKPALAKICDSSSAPPFPILGGRTMKQVNKK
jgi:hypothetical protein